MYKIVDTDGWEHEKRFTDLPRAISRLRKIRSRERPRAIVIEEAGKGETSVRRSSRERPRSAYDIQVDVGSNRLYLEIGAVRHLRDIQQGARDLRQALNGLLPGFGCIADLRRYRPLGERQEEYIIEIQQLLVKAGVGLVVRIGGPREQNGILQAERLSVLFSGYSALTVPSRRDAEEMLDRECSGLTKS